MRKYFLQISHHYQSKFTLDYLLILLQLHFVTIKIYLFTIILLIMVTKSENHVKLLFYLFITGNIYLIRKKKYIITYYGNIF